MSHIDLSQLWRVINTVYYRYLWCTKRFQVYYGGAGSGKSVFVAQKVLFRVMTEPKTRVLVLRKVSKSTRYSTLESILDLIIEWNLTPFFEIHKSEYRITFKGNGNDIIFAGLDDPEKIKSIRRVTIIWMEEATEFTPDDLKQLNLRLRGIIPGCPGKKKEIYLSFNPIDEDHWLKARFFDTVDEDCEVLKTTYLDNKYLEQDDIKELLKLKEIDPVYYAIYALGEWGQIKGQRIFPHNIIIHEFSYGRDELQNVRHGLDFGFNHASALESFGYRDGEMYIFDEFWKKGRTNTELIKDITDSGFDKRWLVRADSAEPDRIKEFKQAGFNIEESEKGAGSLKGGIDYLRGIKIHIHKTKCPNAAREFPAFRYKERRDGLITEDPIEINDDTIAAVRYGAEDLWRVKEKVGVFKNNFVR